jgi:hypothetical protein
MQGKYRALAVVAMFSLAAAGAAFGAPKTVLVGTRGPDTINGTSGVDVIYGRAGNDSLHGRDGNDVVYGGPGNDLVKGGDGNDVEYGGDGNDTMYGGRGADALYGGPGNDTLYALADDNQIDIVDCGAGHDVAWLNVREKGRYVIRGCEIRNWIVPTPEQGAEESAD